MECTSLQFWSSSQSKKRTWYLMFQGFLSVSFFTFTLTGLVTVPSAQVAATLSSALCPIPSTRIKSTSGRSSEPKDHKYVHARGGQGEKRRDHTPIACLLKMWSKLTFSELFPTDLVTISLSPPHVSFFSYHVWEGLPATCKPATVSDERFQINQ